MIGARPILPKKPFRADRMLKSLVQETRACTNDIREDFLRPTQDWQENSARFSRDIAESSSAIEFEVSTDTWVYRWLNYERRCATRP